MKHPLYNGKISSQRSQRQLKVAEVIRQAISRMLISGDIYHPAIENVLISVLGVKITPDLKFATILLTIHGQEKRQICMRVLQEMLPVIRKLVAPQLKLRSVPNFKFQDSSYTEGEQRLDQIFSQLVH